MKIRSSEIVVSAINKNQYPAEGLPEIALVGRSNVGKSSATNALLKRRNFARTRSWLKVTKELSPSCTMWIQQKNSSLSVFFITKN